MLIPSTPESSYAVQTTIPIGLDEDKKELTAVRFNLRIPFGTRVRLKVMSDQKELQTVFDAPEIGIEKRIRETAGAEPSEWKKFSGWKKFAEDFCESKEGGELLNVPIGPLLLEKVSEGSAVGDFILKQSKRDEIKKQLIESKKEFKETIDLLKNIWEYEPPEREGSTHSGQRKLGNMLESLGFMSAKGSVDEYDYTFKMNKELTVWDVVNRILRELDGQPLYVKALTPKTDKETRVALTLASQRAESNPNKLHFGIAGMFYNIPLKTVSNEEPVKKDKDSETPSIVVSKENFTEDKSILIEDEEEEFEHPEPKVETKPEEKKPEQKVKSTVEVLLHLGKWLSGETIDDNWLKRLLPGAQKERVPIPGIRLLPFKRNSGIDVVQGPEAIFDWTVRLDLVSLGVDIKGTTKSGLTFLEGIVGHFGLGAVEVRLAVKLSAEDLFVEKNFFDRVSIGVGVKLKDLRLSFGPREKEEEGKKNGDEIIAGLQELLADEWAVVPAPKQPEEKTVKTRLSAKKKDRFSISVGYLTPLSAGSHGTLDIQLYDEKGNRGKMALIPIDRQANVVYLKQIGIGLKGVENVELSKGLPDSAHVDRFAHGRHSYSGF